MEDLKIPLVRFRFDDPLDKDFIVSKIDTIVTK